MSKTGDRNNPDRKHVPDKRNDPPPTRPGKDNSPKKR